MHRLQRIHGADDLLDPEARDSRFCRRSCIKSTRRRSAAVKRSESESENITTSLNFSTDIRRGRGRKPPDGAIVAPAVSCRVDRTKENRAGDLQSPVAIRYGRSAHPRRRGRRPLR